MLDISKEVEEIFQEGIEGYVTEWDYRTINIPFSISPEDFVKYSEIDIKSDYEHHLINSLTNVKRAIECQLDCLLLSCGYNQKMQKESWSFPKKIELLEKIGIISPVILRKINRKRNLLEHQYQVPEKNEVEDAIDIARLFIAYSDKYLKNMIRSFTVGFLNDEEDNESYNVSFTLDYEKGIINRSYSVGDYPNFRISKSEDYTANDEKYLTYLKYFIKVRDDS